MGVRGKSIYPDAAAFGGISYGVYGESGIANAGANGTTYGGYFTNSANSGAAAYGLYANSVTGATDSAPLVVAVAGAEKFRVNSSGNDH